jgi:hypothetical protein
MVLQPQMRHVPVARLRSHILQCSDSRLRDTTSPVPTFSTRTALTHSVDVSFTSQAFPRWGHAFDIASAVGARSDSIVSTIFFSIAQAPARTAGRDALLTLWIAWVPRVQGIRVLRIRFNLCPDA